MSCLYKIRQGMPSYTDTEKKLADYILHHAGEVTFSSAQKLGREVGVSAAAVIRFSHRLGYRGFTALKIDLAADRSEQISGLDDVISESDSMETVLQKAKNLNGMLQDQAFHMVNTESLQRAVDVLRKCRNVYLFGFGGSGIVCTDFMEKLSRIGRSVIYRTDLHDQIAMAALMTERDVALAVSYSGRTREVNTGMRLARELGATTIAVTQFKKSPLTRLADILLYIPTTERELRIGAIASRNASLILTDLLYLGLAKENFKKTKECLVKTRNATERLRKR
ncbi:MAG TPA: MurR/RpiR family transcriptional regulator [Ruminococcaceae bacterium]|nr:MurR/RpiR family transcriptional regulator [Oscillospiraceae bacterium]HBG55624.1 MurR/RpiR family transcriptional regulator [Oscillospiraceae bacterium]HBQ46584.1 MurR/RpiR family transcriptional regulator [Oscillospiraceae bacterium]